MRGQNSIKVRGAMLGWNIVGLLVAVVPAQAADNQIWCSGLSAYTGTFDAVNGSAGFVFESPSCSGLSGAALATCQAKHAGDGGCYYFDSPRYNQRDSTIPAAWFQNGDRNSSTLGAPTAAANALSTITRNADYKGGSLVARLAGGSTVGDRITGMARYFIGVTSNTWAGIISIFNYNERSKFADLASQGINGATPYNVKAETHLMDGDWVIRMIKSGYSAVQSVRVMTESCSTLSSGVTACTYKDIVSGFTLAYTVNGYYNYLNQTYVRYYDPWGGWSSGDKKASIVYYTIKPTTAPADPGYGSNSRKIYQSGTVVWVLSDASAINTN